MAQTSARFENNLQPTYHAQNYSSAINPNIPDRMGISGAYEVPQASSYVSSPTTKITFNQSGGVISASRVQASTLGYTPRQTQASKAIAANPQLVNIIHTDIKELSAQVGSSNIQQAGAPSYMSNNQGGGRISYVESADKSVEDKQPQWLCPLVTLIGFLLITFAFFWGLGIFGGTKAQVGNKFSVTAPLILKESVEKIASAPNTSNISRTATSSSNAYTTTTLTQQSSSPSIIPPIQVKTVTTTTPTTKKTVITTTQPLASTIIQPNYANSIPAIPISVAAMTSPNQPTKTTTTQSVTVQHSSVKPPAAITQPTSTSSATTQPTSTTTATTQPTSTTTVTTQPNSTIQPTNLTSQNTQPTTTVTTTTTDNV